MIDSYSFGRIEIDGDKYTNDVIIFPDEIESNWWRKEGHSLHPSDLETVVEERPDVLIVGTGAYGRMEVPKETRKFIEDKGIELIVLETEEAVEEYNHLKSKKKAVAALHLTC